MPIKGQRAPVESGAKLRTGGPTCALTCARATAVQNAKYIKQARKITLNIIRKVTQWLAGGVITGEPAVTDVLTGAFELVELVAGLLPPPVKRSDAATMPPATTAIAISGPYVLPGDVVFSP